MLVVGAPAGAQPAHADAAGRTVGASLALASVWDDETHLGRGPAVAAEVTAPLGPHVRVGADVGWFPHRRDSGYLASRGHLLHAMGRASLFAGPARWQTRPFLGAALGLARSTGTLTFRDPFSPTGAEHDPWALTGLAWDVSLGVRHTAGPWAVRPEVRLGAIGRAGATDGLETPLLRLQGGMTVEWAGR